MGRKSGSRAVVHGRNAYKRGLCRCDICREANREYERSQRQRSQVQRTPSVWLDNFTHDTMTLSEFRKHRGYDKEEEGR